jgi:hypothetical protein
MKKVDAYKYILRIWTDSSLGPEDFNAEDLMLRLVMLGYPCTKGTVLKVARAYCDSETENRGIGRK